MSNKSQKRAKDNSSLSNEKQSKTDKSDKKKEKRDKSKKRPVELIQLQKDSHIDSLQGLFNDFRENIEKQDIIRNELDVFE